MLKPKRMSINATQLIHSIPVDPLTGSISVPIYQTSTFVQEAPGINKGYDYARTNNPTRATLEEIIAKLENGSVGAAFGSGLAAIDAVIKLLKAGDEILAVDDIYGGAFRLFTHIYQKFGINVNYVDTTNVENVFHAVTPRTKLIWIETPTNPTLKISDIEAIAKIARANRCLLCVDNTFASPALQQPLSLGADIVVHSATKYLGGHSDLIAGLVVTKEKELGEKIKFIQNASGAILSPFDSWLVIRGIETLNLRVKQHCINAQTIAEFLEAHPAVDKVYYPGLRNHLNHDIAVKQAKGFGGIVSFTLKNDTEEAATAFVTSTKYFKLAESLGGVKSLLCHPAQMTHKSIPVEKRRAAGVADSLIRLSVGLEEAADLINDLANAFTVVVQTKNENSNCNNLMETHKKLTMGLFGFGVVGEGLYKVLQQTPSLKAGIKKICIKDASKKRNAPAELFTTDKNVLLDDPEINVIVEVINESEAAFEIVTRALLNDKDVVSASKKMIAEHLPKLLELQRQTGRSFLYESAACASIPVIRNLEEYYDNDLLHSIRAIVNGSTNFILTKMFEEGLDFKQALILAQQLGFAESDSVLDVEGYDAVNKWSFLLTHAYGIVEEPDAILFTGIQNIHAGDAAVSKARNQQIKLVAQAKKLKNCEVAAFILPQFVNADDHLAFVKNEFNGVVIESSFADKQFFYGKGAGSFPTASAVLSDIAALRYQYKYEYKKLYHHQPHELSNDFFLRVYVSFSDWKYIPREDFEWIEEWHASGNRKYLVGVIAFEKLKNYNWWKENGTSLILTPEPIIEETATRRVKKRSLELAGIL